MVPMVATMDGTRPIVTSAPLMQPASNPVPSPTPAMPGGAHAVRRRQPHGHGRERDDGGHRNVDLAGDDQQRQRQRDDRPLGEIERGVRQRVDARGNTARCAENTMNSSTSTSGQHRFPAQAGSRGFMRAASRMVRLYSRCRALSSTATRITTPLMNICQKAEMPDERQAAADDADEQAARAPRPPPSRCRRRSPRRRSGRRR